ncbi:transposase, partial [Salmonella enterica subsp. enterica]|nr:transposase [Salmonella enterica subsp. enterica]
MPSAKAGGKIGTDISPGGTVSKKKNTTTPTPHDAAFRSFLANPD